MIIIPARYDSRRLPGKLLLQIAGKPIIQHTWERCVGSMGTENVIVLTDNENIAEAVTRFGGRLCFDPRPAENGTARCIRYAREKGLNRLLNVQAENINIDPFLVRCLYLSIHNRNAISAYYRTASEEVANGKVSVVMDVHQHAKWFSRYPIPYNRKFANVHIGVYGYGLDIIQSFEEMVPTVNSSEDLEQLQILENGYAIRMIESTQVLSIDTMEEYMDAKDRMEG